MQILTNRSRIVAASILLGAPVSGAISHAVSAQGLTYDMKMTAQRDGSSSGSQPQVLMTAHGQYSGGNSRLDIDQSVTPGGMMGKGTYIVVRNATRNEWIVDPEKHQYIEMNIDSAAKFAANMQLSLGPIVSMKTSDVTADLQPLGPGETIQGYATTKYRLTYGATSTVTVFGRTKKSNSVTTMDMWIAPQLAGLYNPAPNPAMGNSAAAQKLAAAYAKMGNGVAIKTVSHTQTTGDDASAMSATMELLNIKRTRIDPSVFEVPAGYAKIDMTAAMSALNGNGKGNFVGQLGDSAKAGAKEGASNEVKNQAKDKAKGIIRGIFGRP